MGPKRQSKGIKRKRSNSQPKSENRNRFQEDEDELTQMEMEQRDSPRNLKLQNDLFSPQLFGGGGGGHDPPSHIKPEPIDPNLSFASVAGLDELIEEVQTRIIFPIVNKEFVERHGRSPPKGILLHGPPGTGKTLFVQCLAAELSRLTSTKYTFFMRRGSDIMSMWVGQSETNLREIFARAIQCKPAILFFDEVDGLAPNRNKLQSAIPVYTNVVTTLLGEMDKVKNGDVLVICATNRKDAVDPAMQRPGRCDIHIQFSPPNINGRRRIIQLYTKTWGPSSPGAKLLNQISMGTNGFTGADLDKLCSEAFFACVRRTQRSSSSTSSYEVRKVGDNERILMCDWLEALTSMRPSDSNVFGSYIQVLQVSEFIQPLIQNSAKSLLKMLKPHYLNASDEKIILKRNIGGPNCFLAWSNYNKSEDILDILVVPTILGQLSNMSTFVLNEESMLQEHKQFTINAIIDIVKQAKNYPKHCVLFIPRIDYLAKRLGGEISILKKLLFDTASKSVLVLATAGCDLTGLSKDLQPVFDGHEKCWKLEKPGETERREFYAQIFENTENRDSSGSGSDSDPDSDTGYGSRSGFSSSGDNGNDNRKKSGGKTKPKPKPTYSNCGKGKGGKKGTNYSSSSGSEVTMKSLFEETVKATDHEDMWSMVTLHRELANALKVQNQNQNQNQGDLEVVPPSLVSVMKKIVDAYKESRLDCSKKS